MLLHELLAFQSVDALLSYARILTILAAEVRADDEKEDGHEPSRFEVNRELYESLYLTAVK